MRFQADVKTSVRRPFQAARITVYADSRARARETFAWLFDVPTAWVRVKGAY